MTQDVACDFCGSAEFVFFYDKMRNGINLKTVLCKCCALAQTNPQPTAESLATFYGRFYHLFHQRVGVDSSYVAKSKRMADRRFQLVTRFLDPAARSIVARGWARGRRVPDPVQGAVGLGAARRRTGRGIVPMVCHAGAERRA